MCWFHQFWWIWIFKDDIFIHWVFSQCVGFINFGFGFSKGTFFVFLFIGCLFLYGNAIYGNALIIWNYIYWFVKDIFFLQIIFMMIIMMID
jgi:hypothetical protein